MLTLLLLKGLTRCRDRMTVTDVEISFITDPLLSSLQRTSHLIFTVKLWEVGVVLPIFVGEEIKTKIKGLVQGHADTAWKTG